MFNKRFLLLGSLMGALLIIMVAGFWYWQRTTLPPLPVAAILDTAPYPPSPLIREMRVDKATRQQLAPGSDNWAITWAADDHQYTTWGDGGGFGGANRDGRVSLGVARVEGDADTYTGHNVWGGKNPENPAQFGGKGYGIISIDGVLYMWVSPGSNANNYSEARLARSNDLGATWETADWALNQADSLVLPTFAQFGRDYEGARDQFVYIYAIELKDDRALQVQQPGEIALMRVPANALFDRQAYQFYAGLDSNQSPQWSDNLRDRQPVFENPDGVGWNASVSYNAALGRYFLATEHTTSFIGNLGLFDAPEPWGPWTTVGYYQNWENDGQNFFWNFANKWASEDGRQFTLVYTGVGDNDAWITIQGEFILQTE